MQGAVKTSLRDVAWKIGGRVGLTALLQSLQAVLRDPARRRVPALADALGGKKWDLVVAHSLVVLPLAIELRRRGNCRRVIFDAHEVFDEQRDSLKSPVVRAYWRRMGDLFAAQADGVSTVTPRIASELRARHALAKLPTVLYNACPYREARGKTGRLRALYDISAASPILLCQGGLLPGRGLEDIADAAPILAREGVAVAFLGTGPADYLESLARRSRGAARIGKSVSQDELLDHTADADLGVISNRGEGVNNTMGGPNRLFEYLEARVPVLSHEHLGVRDVLEKTGTGWCVPWRGGAELASLAQAKLGEAKAIPAERLEKAARDFSWESEAPKLLALVSEVLGQETA
jgi:glycosyltransferase involved in cell wall biosynthesis